MVLDIVGFGFIESPWSLFGTFWGVIPGWEGRVQGLWFGGFRVQNLGFRGLGV